jgi:hypothetical protein
MPITTVKTPNSIVSPLFSDRGVIKDEIGLIHSIRGLLYSTRIMHLHGVMVAISNIAALIFFD